MKRVSAALVFILYVSSVIVANWLTEHYGMVGVGFGLTATAGTYAAGAALGLRDILQDAGGKILVLIAIAVGSLLSFAVASPKLAVASAVAFGLSEFLDLLVYTPLRRAGWSIAVACSNAVGAVVDTLVFLKLAGFAISSSVVAGQLVGKGWATLALICIGVVGQAVKQRRIVAI